MVDNRRSLRGNGKRLIVRTLEELEIRESVLGDSGAIEALFPESFPEENLLPLVRGLLVDVAVTTSLVGVVDSQIAAHIIFTRCGVAGSSVNVALLGPLAVATKWQRQGIGSAIVRAGLRRLEDTGVRLVCVLGDPAYYKRLGFLPESLILPPYRLPAEWEGAWQSKILGDKSVSCSGRLSVPRQWQEPALWAP